MSDAGIRFDNGAAYERYMGKWSQLVGELFLDWLAPKSGLKWLDVGCGNGQDVEIREITVQRSFADFDDYWETILGGPSVGAKLAAASAADIASLKARMRERLTADADGRITYRARANAVKGRVAAD
jgi:hypothetical protein